MRRNGNAKGEEFGGGGSRVAAARAVTAGALLCGIALSPRLWFPAGRSFPRAPLADFLPRGAVPAVEFIAGGLLVAALAGLLLARRPALFATLAAALACFLVLLDQTRLQPWVYQYLLLLAVAALHARAGAQESSAGPALAAMRLIVASLYFWSGAQKLNYSFGAEVLPQLLSPLWAAPPLSEAGWAVAGAGLALCEMFAGGGLLHARTRRLCVGLVLAMHAAVLGLLILRAHNSVVWAWNAALMLLVVVLFRRGADPAGRKGAAWRTADAHGRAALALAAACALLPAASFRGWWDMYLSGALYSGNTPVGVVRLGGAAVERLPEAARRQVFTTGGGERMLPIFEWSMAELNVPPYPEPRVFESVAREVCRVTEGEAELIVKGRPAALDGSYRVVRKSCAQLSE